MGAKREETGGPSDLNACLYQLFEKTLPSMLSTHEDIEVFLLELRGDLLGDFRTGRRASNGCESRGRPVHELDSPFPKDDVIGCPQPHIIRKGGFLLRIKIGILQIADGLENALRKERGHPCVKGRSS